MRERITFTIIPTYKCNMYNYCSYCYAKEMSDKYGEISVENFRNIINWLNEEYKKVEIVLIGGESTMHSKFDELLSIMNENIKSAKLYTNNMYGEDILNLILRSPVLKKFNIHYEEKYFFNEELKKRYMHNIDTLYNDGRMINLRFNINSSDFEYENVLNLAQKYKALILYSISAPGGGNNDYVPIEFVESFAPRLLSFVKDANEMGIKLKSARPLPFCSFSESELEYLIDKSGMKGCCSPYKAINPDMSVLGCSSLIDFGMIKVQNKNEFIKSLDDFEYLINEAKWEHMSIGNCEECNYFHKKICQGGCLTYKGPLFNNPLEGGVISSCSMNFYDRH